MITLYGLKTCDTCRKARKALEAAGKPVSFIDLRTDDELSSRLPEWLNAAGAAVLVNKKSTTWRGMSAEDRQLADGGGADVAALLAAHPSLIKRPVLVTDTGDLHVGWTVEAQSALGV